MGLNNLLLLKSEHRWPKIFYNINSDCRVIYRSLNCSPLSHFLSNTTLVQLWVLNYFALDHLLSCSINVRFVNSRIIETHVFPGNEFVSSWDQRTKLLPSLNKKTWQIRSWVFWSLLRNDTCNAKGILKTYCKTHV